jgi:hypothetical protein
MQNYGIFTEMGESHRLLNRAGDTKQRDILSKIGLFVPYSLLSAGCLLIARGLHAYRSYPSCLSLVPFVLIAHGLRAYYTLSISCYNRFSQMAKKWS